MRKKQAQPVRPARTGVVQRPAQSAQQPFVDDVAAFVHALFTAWLICSFDADIATIVPPDLAPRREHSIMCAFAILLGILLPVSARVRTNALACVAAAAQPLIFATVLEANLSPALKSSWRVVAALSLYPILTLQTFAACTSIEVSLRGVPVQTRQMAQAAKGLLWGFVVFCCVTLYSNGDRRALQTVGLSEDAVPRAFCACRLASGFLASALALFLALSSRSNKRSSVLMALVTLYLTFKSVAVDRLCPVALGTERVASGRVHVLESRFDAGGRYAVVQDDATAAVFLTRNHAILDARVEARNETLFLEASAPVAALLLPPLRPLAGSNVLMLGSGSPTLSRQLCHFGANVTVASWDASALGLAEKHFACSAQPVQGIVLQDPMTVMHALHERFRQGQFKLIVHDVSFADRIVPEVFTVEALLALQRLLAPDGVLALQVSSPRHHTLLYALTKTLQSVFREAVLFRHKATVHRTVNSWVYFASSSDVHLAQYAEPEAAAQPSEAVLAAVAAFEELVKEDMDPAELQQRTPLKLAQTALFKSNVLGIQYLLWKDAVQDYKRILLSR